jgi:LacI family transcriptional regulator
MLEGSGLRVPQDIAVAGFDYLSRWEPKEFDQLTTSKQDFEGFGRFAADLLLDRLEGDHASPPKQILLEAPLVIRSSTASDHPQWVTHSEGHSSENLA